MRKQLAEGFEAYLSSHSSRCEYGTGAGSVPDDGLEISLTLVFRSGHRYCCQASSCHHGLQFRSGFDHLRDCFQEEGAEIGKPMRIRLRCIYERGALFAVNPSDAHPAYESTEKGFELVEVYNEAEASD